MLVLPRMLLQKHVPHIDFYILGSCQSQIVCMVTDRNRAISQMPYFILLRHMFLFNYRVVLYCI